MADGKVVIDTGLNTEGIEKGLNKLNKITKSGLSATAAAIGAVTAGLVAAGGYAAKAGSDFEAGMSKVSAISGATGKDLEALTDKAKEMGAKTKFSATEAASAFEYMAMAGWKTDDMLNGIEGIMNLAAASGENLASVSDIVTDALTAFGLSAKDSGHFADVLAKASSSSNTNVGMMGATFKYVAPIAGSMKYSIEDTAVAIGLMANAGIKGEQAGTSLRAMLTRLVKPPKEAAAAMEDLGLSMTNADGTMKPLNNVVKQLRGSFTNLDDSQKASYASAIAGQEAMSGLLAIVGASDEDFNTLVESINSADGAAEEMAETMQDNLQGKITILKSSAEGLGIAIYEHIQSPFKSAAESGIEYINRMTDAFKSGNFEGLVREAGAIFSELSIKATEQAPKMVNAAVSVIQSFIKGIISNRGKLYDSAVDIVDTLAGGLAKLLPKELSKPVENSISAITRSLKGGGIKEAGKTVSSTFTSIIDVTGKLANVALPPLTKAIDSCARNLDILIPLAIAGYTAFKGYSVASTVSAWLKGLSATVAMLSAAEAANAAQVLAASGALTAKEIIIGVLTGKITLATAAQAAWNVVMSANPVGLLVVGVTALIGGIVALGIATDGTSQETYKLTKKQKESLEACNDVTQSLEDQHEAREKSVQAISREYDNYGSLISELENIADENGKVKSGYEDRAKVITNQLSDALGIEIELIDGTIQKYKETVSAIKEVIVQKKAEALLSSLQNDMAEAYSKTEEAMRAYKDAAAIVEKKNKAVESATKEVESAQSLFNEMLDSGTESLKPYYDNLQTANKKLKEAEDAQKTAASGMDEAKSSLSGLSTEVDNYNALMDAMASGESEKIETAMNALVTSYKSYNSEALKSSKDTREEMYSQASSYIDNMKLVQNGSIEVADSVYKDMAKAAVNSISEFNKLPGGVSQGIRDIGPEASSAMISALAQADIDGKLDAEAKAGLNSFVSGFDGLDEKTKGKWSQAWFGALKGLEGFEKLKDPAKDGADAFLKSLKEALDVHSPSRKVKEIFENVWPGASEGLDKGKDKLKTQGNKVVTDFLKSIGDGKLLEGAKDVGSKIMSFFGIGVSSKSENSKNAGKENAVAANSGAGSVDPTSTGNKFSTLLGNGVTAMSSFLENAGITVGDSADKGSGSINPTSTGNKFGTMLGNGIYAMSNFLKTKGTNIASSANSGAGSINPTNTGNKFGTMLGNGVYAMSGFLRTKGTNIAENANAGAGSINPTRTGNNFGSLLGNGVTAMSSLLWGSGNSIAGSANNGADAISPYGTGNSFSHSYANGIKSVGLYSTGRGRADDANRGIGSVDASGAGYNFVDGFSWGMGTVNLWNAAYNIGRNALDAIKAALGIKSPSREAKKVGNFFGQGMALGIDGSKKDVEKSSQSLADTALSGLDIDNLAERTRMIVDLENTKIGKAISATVEYKVTGAVQVENQRKESDLDALADKIVEAFERSGFGFKVGTREFARLVREV